MSSKMQLTGYSRASWQLWIVQMIYIALSCLNMTSYLQLTIANLRASCLLPIDDGSFKCIQRCSWRAVPGPHDSSEWFTRYSLMMYCFNMTSSSQLTIVSSRVSWLPPIDGSFKCPQRCSWRAIPGTMTSLNGLNERLWRCLAIVWHPILSWELPTRMQAVYPQ